MKIEAENLLAESAQDELWLVSYADLLTLLIGFFVLMIAALPVKASRFERIAASIAGDREAPLQSLRGRVDRLIEEGKLEGRIVTREDAEGLGIEMKDALLFDSGSAVVRGEGRRVIADVARLLDDLPGRSVIIEGHTDDVPIRTATFRSNWELSAQRAINVLGALEASGVLRERMSVRGFADTRPLAGERSANRRVVIRVE